MILELCCLMCWSCCQEQSQLCLRSDYHSKVHHHLPQHHHWCLFDLLMTQLLLLLLLELASPEGSLLVEEGGIPSQVFL